MDVDIIIISNAKTPVLKKVTEKGLRTLFESEDDIKFNVFIIEGNKDASYNNLHKNIKTFYQDGKFGYNKYLNFGRKLGKSEYVCLCNNDLIYHKGWASNLIDKMKKLNILSSSPISHVPHHTKFKNLQPEVQFGYEIRKYLTGWCIFQKREIYDKIGDLDEQFDFWYCDDDYGMTLEKYKIKHALITSSRVDHIESTTLKTFTLPERNYFTTRQKIAFQNKWKGI